MWFDYVLWCKIPRKLSFLCRSWLCHILLFQCRELHSTYKAKLQVTLQWKINDVLQGSVTKAIGQVPIMVKVMRGLPVCCAVFLAVYFLRVADMASWWVIFVYIAASLNNFCLVCKLFIGKNEPHSVDCMPRGGWGVGWILHCKWKWENYSHVNYASAKLRK